jgi:hypothetical protein
VHLSGPATFSVELDGEAGLEVGVPDRGDDSRGLSIYLRGGSFRGQEQGHRCLWLESGASDVTPLTGRASR